MKWVLLLGLFACGGAAPVVLPPPAVRVTTGSLDVTALLAPTASRAARAGAGSLALVTSGLLREGDRTGAFVEPTAKAKPQSCLFVFARGAASLADVDLSVFSDEGEPLAQDEEPDATPALLLCPPYPSRMYVSARAASGEGLIAVGAQAVPLAAAEAVRRGASARGSMGVANRRLDQWPELEHAAKAELKRLGPGARETRRVGLPGDRALTTSLTEEVAANTCASLLLLPEASLLSLDVELQDEDGALLLRSARPDEALQNLHFCTDTPRKLTVSFRPHVGRGLVGAVWFRAARESADGARVLAARSGSSTWLTSEIKRLGAQRESQGAKKLREDSFVVKPSAVFAESLVKLDKDACHVVTAVVGAPNARVSMSLLTEDGRALGSRQGGASASSVVCGFATVRAVVGVREAQGSGRLTVHRLGAGRAPGVVEQAPVAASRVASVLDALGGVAEHSMYVQGTQEVPVAEIPRGFCLLVAVAGESGQKLDVTEAGEALMARGEGDARWLRLCADDTARRVKVVVTTPSGIASWALGPISR